MWCLGREVNCGKVLGKTHIRGILVLPLFIIFIIAYVVECCVCLCLILLPFVVLCIVFRTGYGASFYVHTAFSVFMSTCCSVIVVGKCVPDYRGQGTRGTLRLP